jgi:hypothetical protein
MVPSFLSGGSIQAITPGHLGAALLRRLDPAVEGNDAAQLVLAPTPRSPHRRARASYTATFAKRSLHERDESRHREDVHERCAGNVVVDAENGPTESLRKY